MMIPMVMIRGNCTMTPMIINQLYIIISFIVHDMSCVAVLIVTLCSSYL